MWEQSKISELLQIKLPLIQAPMAGGATTPELVAAVSNAGGLGSLGAGYLSPQEISTAIKKIRALTSHPFAVNLFIPEDHEATLSQIERASILIANAALELNFRPPLIFPPYAQSFADQMQVLLEEKIPVFNFTFGVIEEHWQKLLKKNGTIIMGTATSLAEAKLLKAHHVDAIIAQGSEAGGHRGTFLGKAEDALTPTNILVPLLAQALDTPIIAAGGLMQAQEIVSILKLGAEGVQLGSAFLCCKESGIHPLYKKLLLTATKDHTTLTRAFSGKLARGIKNQFIISMQGHENELLDYPIQNALTTPMRKAAAKENNVNFMSMWAGQRAYLCENGDAAQVIQRLHEGVMQLLKTQSSLSSEC